MAMLGSFRRRLLAIAAFTVIACAAAITAILLLARATMEERSAHARENVTREVERIHGLLDAAPGTERVIRQQSGSLVSGYATTPSDDDPIATFAMRRSAESHAMVVIERLEEGVPVFAAAAPVDERGFAFATQRVVAGRETRSLRIVVVALALMTGGLVIAALRTQTQVERGVASLRRSLAALAEDLSAPVARPQVRELGAVADGIAALATELGRAELQRKRLTSELADRERLATLGRIAAGIAHEVRNPLAAMKLRADLARSGGEATPSVARDLEDIASEIGRLDRLVGDLLFVAGRRSGVRQEVDLGELAARRLSLLAPWAKERGVALVSEGSARASIDCDSVSRGIDNLLRNAVDASPAGGRVLVRVTSLDGTARVDVEDGGPGVTAGREAELFEPFFTTKPDGTGLGLALAQAVARAHGGKLVYARERDTTRFTLTLGLS
jgi:signal transduction histidine kinase